MVSITNMNSVCKRNFDLHHRKTLSILNMQVGNKLSVCNAKVSSLSLDNVFEIKVQSASESASGEDELILHNTIDKSSVLRVSGNDLYLQARSLVLGDIPESDMALLQDGYPKNSLYVDKNGFVKMVRF